MANIIESANWENGIYLIDPNDDVLGGVNGAANTQPRQLANRTAYLKARIQETLRLSAIEPITGNYGVTADDIGKVLSVDGSTDTSITLQPLVDFPHGVPLTINIAATCPFNVNLVSYAADQIEDFLNSGHGVVNYVLKPGTRLVIIGTASSWVVVFKTEPAAVVSGYIPGDIATSASASARPGFLLCNGQAVSRVTYAALYTALGNTYGNGDGVATFNVPDYRGIFLRSYNGGSILDEGRVFGVYQGDALQDHHHDISMAGSDNGTGAVDAGASFAGTNPTSSATGDNVRVAAETRPKNQTVYTWIKF